MAHIGTLNERSLHRQLKDFVSLPGDLFEVEMDGFVIDIVRGDTLIEIQTGQLGPLARKLDTLLDSHPVTVVHPIAVRTWLHRADRPPRRSPTKRGLYHLFEALVSFPTLIDHPGFVLEVVLIEEDRHRVHDPTLRRRRGGWKTTDRRLRSVVDTQTFDSPAALSVLVPPGLPESFTTAHLAEAANIPRGLAQQMAYCLRALQVFEPGDRTRAGIEYRLVPDAGLRR